MTLATMADAAFAANIPPGYDIAAGYYGGPQAFNVWTRDDWARFPGHKLPIWVGWPAMAAHLARLSHGQADISIATIAQVPAAQHPALGTEEGQAAVTALGSLGVPAGSITVLDMETVVAPGFVRTFAEQLGAAGYRLWVYGSLDFVFANPPCNGYWPAQYATKAVAEGDLGYPHVRAVQWEADQPPGFDVSLVKPWTEGEMWHG